MRIHSAEFRAMSERVLRVTELTSRLNALPFEDEAVLPCVTIGRDAVVAAGAVVADDVPPAALVTGSKATVHRTW